MKPLDPEEGKDPRGVWRPCENGKTEVLTADDVEKVANVLSNKYNKTPVRETLQVVQKVKNIMNNAVVDVGDDVAIQGVAGINYIGIIKTGPG